MNNDVPKRLNYSESTEERVQRGLQQLAQDVKNWLSGRKQTQSTEIIRDKQDRPLVTNIINNYSYDTMRLAKSMKFGFVSVIKIVVLVTLVVLTVKLLMNPQIIIDSVTWVKEFFHAI